MQKIYHVERNKSKTLKQQKAELEKTHSGFVYLWSDGRQIHFIAD